MLPCKHRFHLECIDQWLSARKPLCPICKWDALQPFTPLNADQEAGAAEPAAATTPFSFSTRWCDPRIPRLTFLTCHFVAISACFICMHAGAAQAHDQACSVSFTPCTIFTGN